MYTATCIIMTHIDVYSPPPPHTHTNTYTPQDYLQSQQGSLESGLSQLLHDKDEKISSLQSSLEEGEREKLILNERVANLQR